MLLKLVTCKNLNSVIKNNLKHNINMRLIASRFLPYLMTLFFCA